MVAFAQWLAVAIYLLPVGLVAVLRARRDRSFVQQATDVAATVAVDLLGVLVLCRIVPLEIAAFVSRLLWLVGAGLYLRRLRRLGQRLAPPADLDRAAVLALALAIAVAVWLSLKLSRPFALWDRELHIPVVSALRGQRIPFASAYDPGVGFHYHFTGDVLAAVLQTFSFEVLNASLALSFAHDVMFALIAATVGLLMMAAGKRPVHVVVLGVAALLLSGPCVIRFGVGEPYLGYSYYALYIWGFRPHQHIAMLMLVGIAGVVLERAKRPPDAPPAGYAGLLAIGVMMSLLAVTDETSTAVVGFALGVAWLIDPGLLAPTRRQGALFLAVLAVAFVGTNLLFEASLSRGSPVQKMAFVAARSPGVQQPPLSLAFKDGWIALIADTVPIWTVLLAILTTRGFLAREGERSSRGVQAFLCSLATVGVFGLTMVEINGTPPESHRFLTAALFMFPVIAVVALDAWPPGTLRRTLVIAGLAVGCFSTLLWRSHYPRHPTPETYFRQRGENLHQTNCRALTGARFGQRPAVVYVEQTVFYSYAGCRTSFVAGHRDSYWQIKLRPTAGLAGLTQIHREMLGPSEPLPTICPANRAPENVDPVCSYALTKTPCVREGTGFVRCILSPADRLALIR